MAKEFLGKGWKFPVEVDPHTGKIKASVYEEDIEEAIGIIISTSPGERMMRPDFGCGIRKYIFEVINANTRALIKDEVEKALMRWEPRIKSIEVNVGVDPNEGNKLLIEVSYVVRATNTMGNKVFPFYIREGVK